MGRARALPFFLVSGEPVLILDAGTRQSRRGHRGDRASVNAIRDAGLVEAAHWDAATKDDDELDRRTKVPARRHRAAVLDGTRAEPIRVCARAPGSAASWARNWPSR